MGVQATPSAPARAKPGGVKKARGRSRAAKRARAQRFMVPSVQQSAVQRSGPDWRGFVPVVGPVLYMIESLVDAVHWWFNAGSDAPLMTNAATADDAQDPGV